MGPQDPKDVTRATARDLSALVGELAALKADAHHWLTGAEYAALRHRLEAAHAAAEAALVEARRRVRLNARDRTSKRTLALGCAMLHISPRREESRVIQLPHHRWRPTSVRELRSLPDTSRRLRLKFLTADVAGACW